MTRVFKFGDNVDTDSLAPGAYMKSDIQTLASHCLEDVMVNFTTDVKCGDIIIGGRNFGVGSSREQAVEVLKVLGVQAIIANSFAGIFYRNGINLGLPLLTCDNLQNIGQGHSVTLDLDQSILTNLTSGGEIKLEPMPGFLMDIVRCGGLVASLEKRFLGFETI
jgi:3-isopropylmalate/(R)-2-methylmalate dehydratase small subunit